MITHERALETLGRFNIDEDQIEDWEAQLGLEIPVDQHGNKVYSPLHINLFKNIKKHLALGRSLVEIKRMVVLPPKEIEKPFAANEKSIQKIEKQNLEEGMAIPQHSVENDRHESNTLSQRLLNELKLMTPKTGSDMGNSSVPQKALPNLSHDFAHKPKRSLERFVSPPVKIVTSSMIKQQGPNGGLLVLIDKLMAEKDDLQSRLLLTEKQKAHLYQANEMFQNRVKELAGEIEKLQVQLQGQENLKLIDDKSRLQKQIIDAEHRYSDAEKKLSRLNSEVEQLRSSLANKVDPKVFLGNWLEEATLSEVIFDNFGINIESRRNRMFKITHIPERFFGHTAIIETAYDYQTNTLWKRTETLVLNVIQENHLEGELLVEYNLDGTPVARANYRVKCYRNGVKPE